MDGRVNKRVDKLITLLLRLEEDMFYGRQQKELTWRPNRRLNEERERHVIKMKLHPVSIC